MIVQRLRQETRHQHEALESALPLGGAQLRSADYDRVLVRFRGFYATWEAEAMAAASPRLAPIVAARRKLHLLEADLRARHIEFEHSPQMDAATLPRFVDGDPTLLGSMYVVEGATLGGQVISRELERSQGFRDGVGYSFFRSYGKAAGQQWKAFTALLETLPEADGDAAVLSAQGTFTAFEKWFAAAGFTRPPNPQAPA